ncbi:MAG TPA: cation:proton antiporter [Stellaceae bacterium]|jgi:CPA1 family monovalent cation:H+ antiporter|nr:cation:proton antiporter [Stellaceae bacterium]
MHDIVLTIFALTGLLALVSFLLPLADRVAIPYAVLLAAVGCAIGGVIAFLGPTVGTGVVGDMIHGLHRFDLTAEALLYIFLPTLLFETALNVDVQRLTEEIAPVLLLAVIGVLVSTIVVGLALWASFGVALLACLMLGAVVATTDPVAVVAIFRDIGAPRRLSMLVEGESLFNDAAAIALYALLVTMLTGEHQANPLHALLDFLRAFAGGLAAGYVAGLLVSWMSPMLRDHRLAETTLTIALAYLTFVISEHYLAVSGVVAVVTAGLVINREGRRRLSPSSWKVLIRTWEQIGFWATSLIFLLAAMMVPALLAAATLYQVAELAVLTTAAFAARAITLYGLLPMLSAAGLAERVRRDHKLVILWGGMRGAVSLALALAATENTALAPEIRQFVGVLATGFVLFTLFVCAPTLRPLMRLLGLDQLSPAELALRDRVTALYLSTIGDDIGNVAREHGIAGDAVSDAASWYRGQAEAAALIAEENAQLPPESRLQSSVKILVEREQELYRQHFDARAMSRRALARLLSRTTQLRDAVKSGGIAGYRVAAAKVVGFPRDFRFNLALQRYVGVEWPLARALADRFEAQLTARVVVQELRAFNGDQLRRLFGEGPCKTVDAELAARFALIAQAIEALMLQYPSYAKALQTQFLTLRAIRLEEQQYQRLRAESIITLEVYNDLMRSLGRRRDAAEQRPRLDLGLKRTDLVARVAMFADIDPRKRAKISRLLRAQLALPGEVILHKGERGDSMYFISSGAVEVRIEPHPVRLGTGDFVGEMAILDGRPRSADVIALGFCRLLRLSSRDFDRLMRTDEGLRAQIRSIANQRRDGATAD